MSVGLIFGGFWLGLGVLLWFWPAAVFVAFSNEDVTPGARAFSVGAMFIGLVLLSLDVRALAFGHCLPATIALVGTLLLVKPVEILGVNADGFRTPRRTGIALIFCGVLLFLLT